MKDQHNTALEFPTISVTEPERMPININETETLDDNDYNETELELSTQYDETIDGDLDDLDAELEQLMVTPDGGWGWVVVLASFFSNVIVDGVCYTFGLLYAELLDEFKAGRSKTALVGSLVVGTYLIIGPVAGALANRFGCRAVTIAGSVIASISFLISSFAVSIDMMLVTYGLCGGIGFGLMYLPSIVVVGYYFDGRRALATGIAVCGSGVGAFVFAPLASWLLNVYGWRGANLIIAAVVLNGLVCGAVYRPIVQQVKFAPQTSIIIEKQMDEKRNRKLTIDVPDNPLETEAHFRKRSLPPKFHSHLDVSLMAKSQSHLSFTSLQAERRPFDRKDVLYGGSLCKLPEYQQCGSDYYSYLSSVSNLSTAGADDSLLARHASDIKDMFDLSLMKSATFIVVGLSGIIGFAGLFTPYVYVTEKAVKQLGVDEWQASLILSVLGVCNTVSRVITGLLVDSPRVDCMLVHNVAAVVAGIATCLVAIIDRYELLMIYAAVFGVFIASFITLRSIVIVELLGIQRLTNAFGLLALCQGFAVLIGSPLSGAVLEATESYVVPFIVAGAMIAFGGIICLPARHIARWEASRLQGKPVTESHQQPTTMTPGDRKRRLNTGNDRPTWPLHAANSVQSVNV